MKEMWACVLAALLCPHLTQASELVVRVADSVNTWKLGSSVVLPCWLDPPQNVQDMEVRWYRPQKFNSPVLLYRNRKILPELQEESYRNRSSLTLRETQSAGLKVGDMSLRLENLNIDDEGIFHCYVSGDKAYGTSFMTLNITVLGSSPGIRLQLQEGGVNVSCSSCGWHPQPLVEWKSDKTTALSPGGLIYSQGKDRLTCVQSWVLLSPSDTDQASCSFWVYGGEKKDSTVDIKAIARLTEDGTAIWKALFTVAVLVALTMTVVTVFCYRKYKTGYMKAKTDEDAQQLVYRRSKIGLGDLRKEAVSITLDTSSVPADLKVNKEGTMVRDCPSAAVNYSEPGFPYHLSVCGLNSFTSGRAYWEVGLTAAKVQPKMYWLIGVRKASAYFNTSDLSPSKGFWFLCSNGQNDFHVNTEPKISLPVDQRPETVGVLLDYGKGELSFYNAKEGVHLFTMKTTFQEAIVPFFNPGIGDKSPLTIINMSNTRNTECSNLNESEKGTSP